MSDKSGFLDIVAEFDQFQDDVDLSYRPSEIGVGEYTVLLTKFAKATFQIFVGEREGDTFTDTFWFPRGATGASMAQRGFLLLARCISGRTIPSVSEAVETLEGAVGNATLMLSIDPSTSKKTGKKYFNVNYKSTVDAT
jgi:hypothetical protein